MKTLFAEEIRRKNPALQNRSVESVADELDRGFRVEPVQDTISFSVF